MCSSDLFVPYKKARAALNVDTNDDYAHAITRLLAGEAGYVFVDDLMQDDLQAELQSPNPDLVAYRAYLTSRITLAQARVREALDRLGPPAAAPVTARRNDDMSNSARRGWSRIDW